MKSGRGGPRPGAGRPPKGTEPAKGRTIRVDEATWQRIKAQAQAAGLTTTDYIIKKALD